MLNVTGKDVAVTWSIGWRVTSLVMLVAVAMGALMGFVGTLAGGDVESTGFKMVLYLVIYLVAIPFAWVVGVKKALAVYNIDVNK